MRLVVAADRGAGIRHGSHHDASSLLALGFDCTLKAQRSGVWGGLYIELAIVACDFFFQVYSCSGGVADSMFQVKCQSGSDGHPFVSFTYVTSDTQSHSQELLDKGGGAPDASHGASGASGQ